MSNTRHGPLDWRQMPGMVEALRLLGARKGPATEGDRPTVTSRPRRVPPRQLGLFKLGDENGEVPRH
jgi:hypothetical protein